MDLLLLLARLVLSGTFLVAGIAKLADLPGSRQSMLDFGLPQRVASVIGLMLPLAEIVVAVALIPARTAWWGSIGAFVLLLVFIAGISITLARGKTPDCHCFGQLHSAPVGWQTLVRNGLLTVIAGFFVWQGQTNPGSSLFSWVFTLTPLQFGAIIFGLVVLVVLAGQAWFMTHLLQQNGRLLVRVEVLEAQVSGKVQRPATVPISQTAISAGLQVGTRAPTFQLPDTTGVVRSLEGLYEANRPALLIFSDANCGPCNALSPKVALWQHHHRTKLAIFIVSRGSELVNRKKQAEYGLKDVLLQQDREVANLYQAHGTPSAVLIQVDGAIGSALAQGAAEIETLVQRVTNLSIPMIAPNSRKAERAAATNGYSHPPQSALTIGMQAPAITLDDLHGRTKDLRAFQGKPVFLLFWNPSCGFCQRMLGDLKAWEHASDSKSPQLVIISNGTVEANRVLGLRSTILLDQKFAVGRQFGVTGTPSAIMIGEDGKIRSAIAVGVQAIFALVRDQRTADVKSLS